MSGFRVGSRLDVISADGTAHFDVVVTFSEPVARGNTSYIFVGEAFQENSARQPVALKVITNSLGGSETSRNGREQLLRRELEVSHRFRHPNILGFDGAAFTDFHTVLVSPFMPNGDLLSYLRHHPSADRNALMVQVAHAVNYLHTERRVVHGNIKCEHVLVSNDGNALLSDVSIPSSFPTAEGGRRETVLPDVQFSAPELLGSDGASAGSSQEKTFATDVYAFGMTVLQAFTGQSPWPGDGPQTIADKVLSGRVHPLPDMEIVDRGLSSIWWQVCRECWGYNAKKRPDMRRVLSDLSRSHKAVLRGRAFLHSIVQGPISEESTRARETVLKALWESEYGNRWLIANAVEVFKALGHQYRLQRAAADVARLGIVRAELRLFDDILTSGSMEEAKDLSTGTQPLSQLFGMSEKDNYETFPAPLYGDAQEVYAVAFLSPKLVVTGSSDNSLRIWDIETGATLGEPFIGHDGRVTCVAVSPDGNLVASGSFDRTVRVWKWNATALSLSDAGFVCKLSGQAQREMGRVCSLAFSPDGLYLASGGEDESLRIWDVYSGRQLACAVHKRGAAVTSLAFAPDGTGIVSGSHDRTMRVWRWDARSRSLQAMKDSLTGHQRGALSVAYSPDGSLIASGSVDHTVCVWDAESQALKHTMRGHTYRVLSLAFSPNGLQLASAAQDNTVRLWDALTGEAIGVLEGHGAPVYGVTFSPDGTRVVSCAGDGSVRVCDRIPVAGQPRRRVTEKECDRIPSPAKFAPVERTSSLRALSRRVTSLVRATKALRDE